MGIKITHKTAHTGNKRIQTYSKLQITSTKEYVLHGNKSDCFSQNRKRLKRKVSSKETATVSF